MTVIETSLIESCHALPPAFAVGPVWLLAEGIADYLSSPFLPLVAIAAFLYLLVIRPERKRQNSQRAMLEAIKKNDRVVTIGGIRGTVISVNREADEMVLKVDDNTKLRMTFGSVSRVETDEKKSETTT